MNPSEEHTETTKVEKAKLKKEEKLSSEKMDVDNDSTQKDSDLLK